MLEILFSEVCFGLTLSKFFDSHDAPSFFIIYAHESPTLGKADSRLVRELIQYLENISSKCRSDRGPSLSFDAAESGARHDILENQFCLLPKEISLTAVDKVVIFYSEALQTCCTTAEGREYMQALKTAGICDQTATTNQREISNMRSGRSHPIKAQIRAVVEKHLRASWFHHVLTELGLVGLRTARGGNPWTTIAVDLHNIGTISDDLGFFGPTQHYVNPPPPGRFSIDKSEWNHQLFFILLKRIYEDRPRIVELIWGHYRKGLASLKENPMESLADFHMTIRYEITEDIHRLGAYVPGRPSRSREERPNNLDPLIPTRLFVPPRKIPTHTFKICTPQQQGMCNPHDSI